jgi:WD40 repeat protein
MEITFDLTKPYDLDFHPSEQLFSVGTDAGDLFLYGYAADSEPQSLFQVHVHRRLCSAVRFVNNGRAILSGSVEGSIKITDVDTGCEIAILEKFRPMERVNRVVRLTESTIASGQSNGFIKVWDTRTHSCCSVFDVHRCHISNMTSSADGMKVLATSGDRTLSVLDLRYKKRVNMFSKEELLSVAIIKNGSTIVCGGEGRALQLYSWDFSEDIVSGKKDFSEMLLGPFVKYVTDMVVVDEGTVITGSQGGVLSKVEIMSGSIQQIAQHSKHDIQHLSVSHDKRFFGSTSAYASTLKIWDLNELI